ncbi:kinase [Catenulispora sp. NF23]|uniref:kinase n=1 Tax=Catenulispora pinistramenti TaxID=2705254 RepID=UPI001BAAD070|nr:kinase [Catenulispora pinistramenti]MBS2540229.1 kinase [Catenulispora pinistramenti]
MPSLLIVLRGPSGSGKSRTATALRERYGRGLAIVRQDVVRREILRERDMADAVNIGLIDSMARHILARGVPCVVEGIMHTERYGAMLDALLADHAGAAYSYYFDIPFDVTVERHFTKPNHGDWSVEDMRGWYAAGDVLAGGTDRVIGPESTERDTIERILAETGLLDAARPLQPSLSD